MIEPQDAYTVLRRPLLPPKPDADETKIIVPYEQTVYAHMLEREAEAVRARYRKTNGNQISQAEGHKANVSRHQQSVAEREALAAKALTIITKRPRTAADLRELLHVSDNKMRAALGWLQSQGKANWTRRDGFAFWEVK